MRLLLATPLYPPEIGGPATYAKFLEAELPSRGIEVAVVPFSRVRHLPPGIRHITYLFLLIANARGASVIFAQDAYSVGFPAVIAAKLLRLPLVIRVPGEYAWEQGVARHGVTDDMEAFTTKRYGWQLEIIRSAQRWTAKRASAIIVPSAFMQRIVTRWGVSSARVHRIENALETVTPEPIAGVPALPVMLSAGRLVGGKGFEGLIALLPQLPLWQLVIAGDGPLQGFLAHEAERLGVTARVHFLGRVSAPLMQGWYRAASVFVLNTRFESFSFQIAEALAAGVPVIATSVGGIPDLVEDGVNGVLVAPHDAALMRAAIESVTNEPEAWKARAEAGKRAMERLSPAHIVPQLTELLDALAE